MLVETLLEAVESGGVNHRLGQGVLQLANPEGVEVASAFQSAVLMLQFEPMAANIGDFREMQQTEARMIGLMNDAVG